jgi:hypothetical protein
MLFDNPASAALIPYNELIPNPTYPNNISYRDSKGAIHTRVGYDRSQTGQWNLYNQVAQDLINTFDARNRIVVEQLKPSQLTPEKIRETDLLYFAVSPGINGLHENWETIRNSNNRYGRTTWQAGLKNNDGTKEAWRAWPGQTFTSYAAGDDISTQVMMTIYHEVFVEQSLSMILDTRTANANLQSSGSRNTQKLFFLTAFFEDFTPTGGEKIFGPLLFRQFMPDMYPDEYGRVTAANFNSELYRGRYEIGTPAYSQIHGSMWVNSAGTATVSAYAAGGQWGAADFPDHQFTSGNIRYNRIFRTHANATPNTAFNNASGGIVEKEYTSWAVRHFQVGGTSIATNANVLYKFNNDYMANRVGHNNNVVEDGKNYFWAGDWMVSALFGSTNNSSVWSILKNRNRVNADPQYDLIVVPHTPRLDNPADGTMVYVITADELRPNSFNIPFEVVVFPDTADPELASITAVVESHGDHPLTSYDTPPSPANPEINTIYTLRTYDDWVAIGRPKSFLVRITATDVLDHIDPGIEYVLVQIREAFDLN